MEQALYDTLKYARGWRNAKREPCILEQPLVVVDDNIFLRIIIQEKLLVGLTVTEFRMPCMQREEIFHFLNRVVIQFSYTIHHLLEITADPHIQLIALQYCHNTRGPIRKLHWLKNAFQVNSCSTFSWSAYDTEWALQKRGWASASTTILA